MPGKNTLKTYKEKSYYHIYNRGVAKGRIFFDSHYFQIFLYYLKIYLLPKDLQGGETLKVSPSRQLKNHSGKIKLLAYCLLPNHFHLLVYQSDATAINFFMRSLATKYSMYFNRKYHRVGPLFQGVYKAIEIEDDNLLIYLSKYIHRNPLPTRRDLEGYKYSSYINYLGLINQIWVDKSVILDYFPSKNRVLSYKEFTEETDEKQMTLIKNLVLEEE